MTGDARSVEAAGRPSSYHVQRACCNCAHVFEMGDYDSGETYFCTLDAPPRPPCGSVAMDEMFSEGIEPGSDPELEEYGRRMDLWRDWSKPREVEAHGICEHYAAAIRSLGDAEEEKHE